MSAPARPGSAVPAGGRAGHRHRRPGPNRLQGLLWMLFANTAVITALVMPVHILAQGVLAPLGLVPAFDRQQDTFAAALSNPLVKLYLLAIAAACFYTAAHRVRYLVHEMGLHMGKGALASLMYGLAAAATAVAGYVLFTAA